MLRILNASHAHTPCAFSQTTPLFVEFGLALLDDCIEDPVVRVLFAENERCFSSVPCQIVLAACRERKLLYLSHH